MSYDDIRAKTALLIFLLTGFRRGEVAGLKWQDIDFENKKITISRNAIVVSKLGLIIKEPKTKKSARTITMPKILCENLYEYKCWQDYEISKLEGYYNNQDWLFSRDNGDIMDPSTFMYWFDKVLDKAGLEHHTIHSLRHTNITLQIAAGVPLVTVSGRAGHSRTSTTTDIYSHFITTSDKSAADAIDNMFNENKKDELDDLKALKAQLDKLGITSIKELANALNNQKHNT